MKIAPLIWCMLLSVASLAQKSPLKIKITHLTKNFYVCTSYGFPDGTIPFPANSMFAVTKAGVILVDTPWGPEQTQQLTDLLRYRFHKKVVLCISTHFHEDRTGGIDVLKKLGAKTYGSEQTYRLAKQNGLKQPEFAFKDDTVFKAAGLTMKTYYPGEGHTKDNIVIWFPQEKIFFGGCLVKSLETNAKGNLADANVEQWPASINNLNTRFGNARYVIPGHQGWQGGTKQFDHTMRIIKKR